VRFLKRREKLTEPDFALLARAFNRARALHPFYLTAWVFLPDHWHCICAPVHPTTISLAMKSVARTAVFAVHGSSIEKAADHRSGGPRYRFRAAGQPRPHRIQVNVLYLLVVPLHGAQCPIKGAKLQQAQPQSKDVSHFRPPSPTNSIRTVPRPLTTSFFESVTITRTAATKHRSQRSCHGLLR
jgi:hypothetical protein